MFDIQTEQKQDMPCEGISAGTRIRQTCPVVFKISFPAGDQGGGALIVSRELDPTSGVLPVESLPPKGAA